MTQTRGPRRRPGQGRPPVARRVPASGPGRAVPARRRRQLRRAAQFARRRKWAAAAVVAVVLVAELGAVLVDRGAVGPGVAVLAAAAVAGVALAVVIDKSSGE